jgi:hypothetical protein
VRSINVHLDYGPHILSIQAGTAPLYAVIANSWRQASVYLCLR